MARLSEAIIKVWCGAKTLQAAGPVHQRALANIEQRAKALLEKYQ